MTPRPAPVTAARWLLLVVAALPMVSALLGVVLIDDLRRAYIAAYGGVRGGDEATGAVIAGVIAAGLILVVCGIPALLLGRPRNWVRIVVWVLCTIGVCCLSPGILGGTSVTSPRVTSTGTSSSEITARIADTMPGWYVPLTVVLAAASVLGVLLVAVLLALPASNAYFRRQPPPQPPWPSAGPAQQWPGAGPTPRW
ncbi:hypothetical protein OHA72_32560 [Dactylosporangium sp. NBC_01737]|uniref:hypothetical protein n=1 Tax=Dactylosporangium sp. NBC_01737 TaxID=2975959 RepID=UPI002E0D2941|nr:hypothetical protein OHA72_32560 [Dactylosporangium sp. NBC_01737]